MKTARTKKMSLNKATPENRKDRVGKSGIYPMSGPLPKGNAQIRGMMEWGQAERGAAGYSEHGGSGLQFESGLLLGGYDANQPHLDSSVSAKSLSASVWPAYCEWLTTNFRGLDMTLERVDQKGTSIVDVRERPFRSLKPRLLENGVWALTLAMDAGPRKSRFNLAGPQSITLHRNASGYPTHLEIDYSAGRAVLHFASAHIAQQEFTGNSWGE